MEQEQHHNISDPLTDVIIGVSDGLAIPFALNAGLCNAGASQHTILYASITSTVVVALAMGAARFFAAKEDVEHRRQHEAMESGNTEVLAKMGFDRETEHVITDEMVKNKDDWKDIMDAHELSDDEFKPRQSRISAFYITCSYAVSGMIPILPYIMISDPQQAFLYSASISIMLLVLFGFFKGKVMSINPFVSALQITLMGVLTAGLAYFLGGIFS